MIDIVSRGCWPKASSDQGLIAEDIVNINRQGHGCGCEVCRQLLLRYNNLTGMTMVVKNGVAPLYAHG
jgi:hypothetical protein